MNTGKKQSFMQGALILAVAGLLVKVIGAAFKIPLNYLILDEGMGLFGASYQFYTVMFIIATAGFPTAISKMVAESLALDRKREAERIFRVALVILAFIGIVGSNILFFAGDYLAEFIGSPDAAMAIKAIAPAVLCVSLMAAFRGYFQGRQNMTPTAVSEVVEAVGKLIFGYLFAWMFMQHSVIKASAGAVFGVTVGTLLGFFSLFVLYFTSKKHNNKIFANESTGSYLNIAKRLVVIAVPITIGASVSSLTNLADMFTVMTRLQTITRVTPEFLAKYAPLLATLEGFDGASVNHKLATALYGMYTGKPLTLFNLPLTIIVALGMSVVPVIAASMAKKDKASAQKTTNIAIKITMLFAVPCAIGLYVLAAPILQVIFHTSMAASMLEKLSVSIIFVSVLQITTSILQAYGKTVVPVVNMIIGGIIKVIVNYNLVAIPAINIDGAPIGTMVCYFTVMALNLIWIVKVTGCRFKIVDYVIKPVISGGVMGVVAHLLYNGTVASVGTVAAMGLSIAVAVVVYFSMLIVVRAFREEDIVLLPKGDKLVNIMKRFHLI